MRYEDQETGERRQRLDDPLLRGREPVAYAAVMDGDKVISLPLGDLQPHDAETRAYMAKTDHYTAARDAVDAMKLLESTHHLLRCLIASILGLDPDVVPADGSLFETYVNRALTQRAHLLSVGAAMTETVRLQAESIDSQQKLIQALSTQAAAGKRASDALMYVAVKAGVNPVPKDAEECQQAILVALGYAPPPESGQ